MAMSPRLLRPRASGTTHPEASSWATRVVANGGTVGPSTLAAVSKFCTAIDAAGIRDRFYRLNLFAGSNLSAALTPLYRSTSLVGAVIGGVADSSTGFVSGDYVETGSGGGLGKNAGTSGTLKSLTTGLTTSNLPQFATAHFAAGVQAGSFTSPGFLMGSNNGTDQHFVYAATTSWNAQLAASSSEVAYSNALAGSGRFVTSRTSNTLITTYRNATSVATNTTAANPTIAGRALNLWPTNVIVGRAYYYSFGNSLTAANVTALDNALSAFLTAMGRV